MRGAGKLSTKREERNRAVRHPSAASSAARIHAAPESRRASGASGCSRATETSRCDVIVPPATVRSCRSRSASEPQSIPTGPHAEFEFRKLNKTRTSGGRKREPPKLRRHNEGRAFAPLGRFAYECAHASNPNAKGRALPAIYAGNHYFTGDRREVDAVANPWRGEHD